MSVRGSYSTPFPSKWICKDFGAHVTKPEILVESMRSPWTPQGLHRDWVRTVQGLHQDCTWTAGGLDRESSPNHQFSVLVQSSWCPCHVLVESGLHRDSLRLNQDSTRTPQGFHKDSTRTFLSLVSTCLSKHKKKKVLPCKKLNSDLSMHYITSAHD